MSSIMGDDDDNSFELDANVIFKQEASQLTTVRDLEDGLNRFGYSKDDRISRRDLVLIYNQIKKAMEQEIFNLANSTRYAEAKELRARLTNLRAEFDHQQISGVQSTRTEQREMFGKASHEILTEVKGRHGHQVNDLQNYFDNQRATHELFNNIETNNLEQAISLIPRPHVRYSKRLIELFKAEYNLNKLKQYDDAIKVRKMIEKILPKEEKTFNDNFDQSIDNRRRKLQTAQQIDQVRFDEKMKTIEWNELRRRELEMNTANQRLKNHNKDMSHTHSLEAKLRPEMSVKPSALWQHRQGYDTTSASLRGQQLLDKARGKKTGAYVFAETLVDKHNFADIPQDTTTFYSSQRL